MKKCFALTELVVCKSDCVISEGSLTSRTTKPLVDGILGLNALNAIAKSDALII